MENKDLLSRLLNFGDDWKVIDILVNEHFKEVDIYLEYSSKQGLCPITNEVSPIFDFRESRRFRHLDMFEYKTYINARIPRVSNKNRL